MIFFFCNLSVPDRLILADIHFINMMSCFVNIGLQTHVLGPIIYHGTYTTLRTNVQPVLNKINNFGKKLDSSQSFLDSAQVLKSLLRLKQLMLLYFFRYC